MKGSDIAMNMGMRHLFKKCQNIEIVQIKFHDDIVFKIQFADCFSEK